MEDLRTERRKKFDQRAKIVCEMYKDLKSSQPGYADNRYFAAISRKTGLTIMGVRGIVRRCLN